MERLLKEDGTDGYELGNRMVEEQGVEVNRDFYKNSSFVWNGVQVENHQFCTPVRGSREMKRLERVLRELLAKGERATFDALFLMEHMWAHFFEEALTMKQVYDWVVFRMRCRSDVDWGVFEREARACGFWNFAEAMNGIVDGMLDSEFQVSGLPEAERRSLAVKQSKSLVRLFKQMRDYIVQNQSLLGQREYLQLSLQTSENIRDIMEMRSSLARLDDKVAGVVDKMSEMIVYTVICIGYAAVGKECTWILREFLQDAKASDPELRVRPDIL